MAVELILGAGYIGAKLGELALARGDEVVLADNWSATAREQLRPLEERGARVETADIRHGDEVEALLELARIAAHESGERTNAPLVCYLVGLARGRYGRALDDLVDAVVGKPV